MEMSPTARVFIVTMGSFAEILTAIRTIQIASQTPMGVMEASIHRTASTILTVREASIGVIAPQIPTVRGCGCVAHMDVTRKSITS